MLNDIAQTSVNEDYKLILRCLVLVGEFRV